MRFSWIAMTTERSLRKSPDEDEEEPRRARNWFVIHSYSGYENKVKKNLEHRIESLGMQDKIFEVVVPTEEEIELKDGQRRTVERRIFPATSWSTCSWTRIRGTSSATRRCDRLCRLGPQANSAAQARRGPDPEADARRDAQGQGHASGPGRRFASATVPLRILWGRWTRSIPDKGKVRILVSFFGRETPVELDFLQVEKI